MAKNAFICAVLNGLNGVGLKPALRAKAAKAFAAAACFRAAVIAARWRAATAAGEKYAANWAWVNWALKPAVPQLLAAALRTLWCCALRPLCATLSPVVRRGTR